MSARSSPPTKQPSRRIRPAATATTPCGRRGVSHSMRSRASARRPIEIPAYGCCAGSRRRTPAASSSSRFQSSSRASAWKRLAPSTFAPSRKSGASSCPKSCGLRSSWTAKSHFTTSASRIPPAFSSISPARARRRHWSTKRADSRPMMSRCGRCASDVIPTTPHASCWRRPAWRATASIRSTIRTVS